jgi:hypothetical protein
VYKMVKTSRFFFFLLRLLFIHRSLMASRAEQKINGGRPRCS